MSGLVPEAFGHDPSATAAFAALPDVSPSERPRRKLRSVVVGGGTGAPVSIRTLLSMGIKTDAVFHEILIQLLSRNDDVTKTSPQINQFQVDKADLIFFYKFFCFFNIFKHRFLLTNIIEYRLN